MSGNVWLNYELIDSGEREQLFNTPQEVQKFVKGIGEDMFRWVIMHIPNDFSDESAFIIVEDYVGIVNYGR